MPRLIKRIIGLIGILILAIAGYTFYWFNPFNLHHLIPQDRLEQFPKVKNNLHDQEVIHQEIVTKQDILNFKLARIDNQVAFKEQLAQIKNEEQRYYLEKIN
jgi:hypothetical protein